MTSGGRQVFESHQRKSSRLFLFVVDVDVVVVVGYASWSRETVRDCACCCRRRRHSSTS